ncbi:MAG: hypothetical protein H6740_24315 [Alphaproteobacteria bacterium]|nr:hypothetical protein [Alphaproteobacteria bacterium]
MGLRDDIIAACMPGPVAQRFAMALRDVAAVDGGMHSSELVAVSSVLDTLTPDEAPPAPMEALWPYRELLIRTSIYVAVIDGGYSMREARAVSALAHQLGVSAHQLAEIEDEVFQELRAKARGTPGG